MIEAIAPAYVTAAAIGALHGVEPGHGWPVAAAYALARRRPWAAGLAAGTLIGGAHLLSSFAVVLAFQLLDHWVGVTDTAWMGRIAGLALMVMGIVLWRRGGHRHHAGSHGHAGSHDAEAGHHDDSHAGTEALEGVASRGLWGIALFAFTLGFAHEEEFAILGLCAGRVSCWGVMAIYAVAVAGVILGLTLLSVAAFDRFRRRLEPWQDRLPRISAVVLFTMGVLYVLGFL